MGTVMTPVEHGSEPEVSGPSVGHPSFSIAPSPRPSATGGSGAWQDLRVSSVARKVVDLEARLRRAEQATIMGLLAALEAKDPYTQRHSLNVSIYTQRLCEAFPLSAQERRTIETAALLHDIGKIGTPDAILLKPGVLTRAEMVIMREHAAIGASIIKTINSLEAERPLVLHHHEWYGGGGYPLGLSGEGIPLGARIIHVADSIDAMASPRSYKPAFGIDKVIGELSRGRGRQFDPAVADAALRWIRRNPHDIIWAVS